MKDFVVFRHPKEKKVWAYTGLWAASDFTIDADSFWVQSFDDEKPIMRLNNPLEINWEILEPELKENKTINTGPEEFIMYVNQILSFIEKGRVKKVVPARRSFEKKKEYSVIDLFKKNLENNPNAFCYLLNSAEFGLWMGASPEVFLNYCNGIGETVALAGTRQGLGKESFGKKELEEQGIVKEYIENILNKYSKNVESATPTPVQAAHLSHLQSKISCEMDKSKLPNLMKELHPTPAVGGFPRKEALEVIGANEKFPRKLYSGWLGQTFNGALKSYVNLRCAQLFENGMMCYAGCGVNQGSVPELEYEETENKMRVMRDLLIS